MKFVFSYLKKKKTIKCFYNVLQKTTTKILFNVTIVYIQKKKNIYILSSIFRNGMFLFLHECICYVVWLYLTHILTVYIHKRFHFIWTPKYKMFVHINILYSTCHIFPFHWANSTFIPNSRSPRLKAFELISWSLSVSVAFFYSFVMLHEDF